MNQAELTDFIEAALAGKNPPRNHHAMANHIARSILKHWVVTERTEIAAYANDEPITAGDLADERERVRKILKI